MTRAVPYRPPRVGDRLAGHLLVEQVGRGGTGVVFRAVEESLGRHVALKVLVPRALGPDEARRRFLREAVSAAAVTHPSVLPVYRVDDAAGHMFITMQYVPGGSLADVLDEQGPAPIRTAVAIVEQLAGGLDAAHRVGVVHRDVKPRNVLIDTHGHVWLADFGSVGAMEGTLDYMAPEQLRGDPVGPATDTYGLACMAYRMLVGHVPFPRCGRLERLDAHLHEAPPDAAAARPGVPPAMAAAIARAMAKAPGDRPASAGAFATDLRSALGHAGPDADDVLGPWGPVPHVRPHHDGDDHRGEVTT